MSKRTATPLPMLHLEFWVSSRRGRSELRKVTRAAYYPARRITQNGRGNGPWVFLVDPDPAHVKSVRLRNVLGVRSNEDLWAEIGFYPNRTSMRKIIGRIWKDKEFRINAERLEALVSKRKAGFQGTVATATLLHI